MIRPAVRPPAFAEAWSVSIDRRSDAREMAPFVAATVLAWCVVPIGTTMDWALYAIASVVVMAAGGLTLTSLGPASARRVVASLLYLAGVGLLRAAAPDGNSGVGALALLPIFYVAMYGDRREVAIVILGVAATFLAPPALLGGVNPYQYRVALFLIVVCSILGGAIQRLVRQVRRSAEQAADRGVMIETVADLSRGLAEDDNARMEICRAALVVGKAGSAILFEPVGEDGTLRSTAMVGVRSGPVTVHPEQRCGLREAFAGGHPVLVTSDLEEHVVSLDLWAAEGYPASILWEPVTRDGEVVGVLVMGWDDEVRLDGPRATVVSMLAREAATAIERADMRGRLVRIAETDALTGLPNRRAWEAKLAQVSEEGMAYSIGILDLDHFKAYNDTYGHPQGDQLLKQTAERWHRALRRGDFIARIGGEEFALLLTSGGTGRAVAAIERLRRVVPDGQTCSAGVATSRPEESVDELMSRADRALYEAKAGGRDKVAFGGPTVSEMWGRRPATRERVAVVGSAAYASGPS